MSTCCLAICAKMCAVHAILGASDPLLATVKTDASDIQPWLVGLRRMLHEHPELMYEEHETSKLICKTLGDLGIKYR